MKPQILLAMVLASVPSLSSVSLGADSKRTAEYLLSSPLDHEGKTVTVDVSFVHPVQWKSPVSGITFFRATTLDRRDYRMGGDILVAVEAGQASDFAKKYGTDFQGRARSTTLKGEFLALGKNRIWLIDTSGRVARLSQEQKVEIPQERGGPDGPRARVGRRPF